MTATSDAYQLDLSAPELTVDPYRTYARLRANRGVHYRSPAGDHCFPVLSRYADVQFALRDPVSGEVASVLCCDPASVMDRSAAPWRVGCCFEIRLITPDCAASSIKRSRHGRSNAFAARLARSSLTRLTVSLLGPLSI